MREPVAVITRSEQCASQQAVQDVLARLREEGKIPEAGGWYVYFRQNDGAAAIYVEEPA